MMSNESDDEVADGPRGSLVQGRLRRRVRETLLLPVAVVAALAVVAWPTHGTDDPDEDVAGVLYARPGTGVRHVASVVTWFGSPTVVAICAVVVAALAWRRYRDMQLTLFCPVAVAVAGLIEHFLKLIVGRARPATAALANQFDFSYPSGHATASSALALSAILLTWAGGPAAVDGWWSGG